MEQLGNLPRHGTERIQSTRAGTNLWREKPLPWLISQLGLFAGGHRIGLSSILSLGVVFKEAQVLYTAPDKSWLPLCGQEAGFSLLHTGQKDRADKVLRALPLFPFPRVTSSGVRG